MYLRYDNYNEGTVCTLHILQVKTDETYQIN